MNKNFHFFCCHGNILDVNMTSLSFSGYSLAYNLAIFHFSRTKLKFCGGGIFEW